ncbi:helix-turn-helix domain-containing protein [Streptomyces sp. ITFR-6]|uniref:MarR family winged helix-turn-helix transcriptional regulator n=1 Tax=Streptomyces sp. ITFR-6 TaxID=3075197 RepID=UPI00288990D2|nr:helix-turn-helix domain-containing protein [Streptomyces sp. ITFR-6]WNI33639.1 helix-turn-helix domain-containing protein [Streptomyces sp. ITFR-6]
MSSSTTPVQLFLLGRTLMKIGEEALPELPPGADTHRAGTRAALVVLSDLLGHPDTSVSAIAVRTGLPQSQVSGAVARLKDAGSIVTAPDPADGRRQLIRPAPRTSERVSEVRASRIDDALATALGTDDPERLREVAEAVDVLARHLTPEAAGRLRA